MIVYKDILLKLKDAGYSTYVIQKERLLSNSTIQKIRTGQPLSLATMDTICRLTGRPLHDLVEYVPDPVEKPEETEETEQFEASSAETPTVKPIE